MFIYEATSKVVESIVDIIRHRGYCPFIALVLNYGISKSTPRKAILCMLPRLVILGCRRAVISGLRIKNLIILRRIFFLLAAFSSALSLSIPSCSESTLTKHKSGLPYKQRFVSLLTLSRKPSKQRNVMLICEIFSCEQTSFCSLFVDFPGNVN